MELAKEWIELGDGACEYAGPCRVVIDAEADGTIREGRSRVFISDEKAVLVEWGVRDVIPHAGAIQLNLINPEAHNHGMTMFVLPDGSLRFNGGEYEPLPEISENPIWAVPLSG